VDLKVTQAEQVGMRQSIEHKQENGPMEMIGTVRFTGSISRLGDESAFHARDVRRSACSRVSRAAVAAASSESGGLKVNVLKRTLTHGAWAMPPSPHQKFYAEPLHARSADLVLGINANVGGKYAALITINQKTEQHRCAAV
jgi:hypothetical protein